MLLTAEPIVSSSDAVLEQESFVQTLFLGIAEPDGIAVKYAKLDDIVKQAIRNPESIWDDFKERCIYCHELIMDFKACGSCKEVRYCKEKDCQKL